MKQADQFEFKKGAFVLSLDFELAWGTRGAEYLKDDYRNTRKVIEQLLVLLVKYDIRATWATVGHLFLDSCKGHNEIPSSKNWFDIDPKTNLQTDPIWYGKDIIDLILSCPVKQEIACHTFSHVVADDPACTPEWFRAELAACRDLAQGKGLNLESFVYPKNHIAHTDILKQQGFKIYRSPDNNWYSGFSGMVKKIAHVLDNFFCLGTRPVNLEMHDGLLSLPGSYFYPHAHGWAKYLPASFRVSKVLRGIDKAVKNKKVFHLWFHPFNLASDPENLLRGLDLIFAKVAELRSAGLIDHAAMGDIFSLANKTKKVLVLDGGVQSALAIVRSLGSKGIQVICGAERPTAMALNSKYCSQSFVYPSPISDPQGFLRKVKRVYDENGGDMLVLACSDATFLPISRNRDLFPGIEKILSDQEQIEIAFDKSKTLELAQEIGIKIPETKMPKNREQVEATGQDLGYPCVLKPLHSCQWKDGKGAWGRTSIVQSSGELGDMAQEIADKTGEWPLIQKYIEGEEFGVFFLMHNGQPVTEFAHKRIRSISPYGGASCLRQSIEMPADLKKQALDLLKFLNWNGVAMVEFKRDKSGDPILMEINGRFWGSLPLALHAGVDFPSLLVDINSHEQEIQPRYKVNAISRHLLADVKHLLTVFFGRSKPQSLPWPNRSHTLKNFVLDFFRPGKGDVFDPRDLRPFLAEVIDVIIRKPIT